MAGEFVKKYGDTEPPIIAQLVDEDGQPAALGAATILLHIRRPDLAPLALAGEVLIGDLDGEMVDEFDGYVTSTLAPTLLVPGIYEAEWQVTWSDATVQSFPNDGFFWIKIVGEIA